MPLKLSDREYRALARPLGIVPAAEKRLASDYYADGYATTFGNWYEVIPGVFEERFMAGALDSADVSDVIFQYEHRGQVFARNKNGSLLIEEDAHGVFFAVDLSKSEAARNFFEEVRNELVTAMSWGFKVAPGGDEWEEVGGLYRRTIKRLEKVFDVSGVAFGANDQTEISARSRVDGAIDTMRRESQARRARVLSLLTRT